MKISIIIPSYQQGKYIGRTLRSIFEQRGDFEYEVLLLDGGSSDETLDVIREFESQITWWRSHKDDGQTAAINEGLHHATGDIIAYINSDDYYLPGTFQEVSKWWVRPEREKFEWLAGACLAIDEITGSERYFSSVTPPSDPIVLFGQPWCPPQPSCFWPKELFNKLGNFTLSLVYVMDVEWCVRCITNGHHPHILHTPLSVRWLHGKAKSSEKSRFFIEMISIVEQSDSLSPYQRKKAQALLRNRVSTKGQAQFPYRFIRLIRDFLTYPPILKTWLRRR